MKYIVWINHGYGGWSPEEFQTLKEAVEFATKNNYSSEFKVTKEVEYIINEVSEVELLNKENLPE